MGTVVERRKVNELPLNGRNVFNLIELAHPWFRRRHPPGRPWG